MNKFSQVEYPEDINENYRRVWTKPVTSYAKNYSKFDISLAPIKHHMFNKVKSQLKVIEAGFYKKALIASNFGPYTIDLTHCLKNGNFEDMGERLYEHVSQRYDLNIVTKNRAEFYKSIV